MVGEYVVKAYSGLTRYFSCSIGAGQLRHDGELTVHLKVTGRVLCRRYLRVLFLSLGLK